MQKLIEKLRQYLRVILQTLSTGRVLACAQCGRSRPKSEMISHGYEWYCSESCAEEDVNNLAW